MSMYMCKTLRADRKVADGGDSLGVNARDANVGRGSNVGTSMHVDVRVIHFMLDYAKVQCGVL